MIRTALPSSESQSTPTLSTPPSKFLPLELRAVLDVAKLPFWLGLSNKRKCTDVGKDRAVFVIPGFGGGDSVMAAMRYFLRTHGFRTLGWGHGINRAGLDIEHDPTALSWDIDAPENSHGETGVPYLCDLMTKTVREYCELHDSKVTLVGWSLGGTIAREVARDLPHHVEQVVTLGSPVVGGPKYTSAAPLLARKGLDLDWIEREVERRNAYPIQCPVSAIVSETDAIVDVSASFLPGDQNTKYISVDVAHMGMSVNRDVMNIVLNELTANRNYEKQ